MTEPAWANSWGGSDCVLYEASNQDENGIFDGYRFLLAQTSGAGYANALGLKYDPTLATSDTVIPPDAVIWDWIVDNGSYLWRGLPPSGNDFPTDNGWLDYGEPACDAIFIGPQNFNPWRPLSAPSLFFGRPSNQLMINALKLKQGFMAAGKGVAAALGSAATVTAVLSVLSTMGGPIGSLAATIVTAITTTTQGLQAAFSTAMAAVSSTGVGLLAAGVGALVFGGVLALVSAFPAEAPGLHATGLPQGSRITTWANVSGALTGQVFVQGSSNAPSSALDVGWGTIAEISNVDSETFFAGLVYLRAIVSRDTNFTRLDLVWTQRVSQAGIDAFRNYRAQGHSVSDSIGAVAAFGVATPIELFLQSIAKGAPVPITQNAQALLCLQSAHYKNESRAATYLASPGFVSSSSHTLGAQIAIASGMAQPHATDAFTTAAKSFGLLFVPPPKATPAVLQRAKALGLPKITPRAPVVARSLGGQLDYRTERGTIAAPIVGALVAGAVGFAVAPKLALLFSMAGAAAGFFGYQKAFGPDPTA